jgi:DNA-binding NtrC family response regulator
MPIGLKPSLPERSGTIFVVEPDEVIRSALYFILNGRNEAHSFASLDRAFLKGEVAPPDLVLLGIELLRSDGERALAEIERNLRHPKILVVADSVNDPLARTSLKRGAHDVLGKPISFDAVRGKVDDLLGHHASSPALLGLLPLSAAW